MTKRYKVGDAIITKAPQKYFINCPHCMGRIFNSLCDYDWFDFQIWDGTSMSCYHCGNTIIIPEEWIRKGIEYRSLQFNPEGVNQ